MLMQFAFRYGTTFTQEQIEKLSGIVRGGFEPRQTDRGLEAPFQHLIAEIDSLATTVPELMSKIEFSDQPVGYHVVEAVLGMFRQLMARGSKVGEQDRALNERVNVHVPGLGLWLVNDVTVLEGGCTDDLQTKLDEGWRILAVCPQPDQRRPDYVLGRHVEENT